MNCTPECCSAKIANKHSQVGALPKAHCALPHSVRIDIRHFHFDEVRQIIRMVRCRLSAEVKMNHENPETALFSRQSFVICSRARLVLLRGSMSCTDRDQQSKTARSVYVLMTV